MNWKLGNILLFLLLVCSADNFHIRLRKKIKNNTPQKSSVRRRTYNSIAKVINGNPYIHQSNIYSKGIYPRQPFWPFEKQ